MTPPKKPRGYGRTCRNGHKVEKENVYLDRSFEPPYAKCRSCRALRGRAAVNSEEGVRCRICGEVLRRLSGHVRIHGITSREYREQFPGAPMVGPLFQAIALDLYRDLRAKGKLPPPRRQRFCKRGHWLTVNTTYLTPNGDRQCRKCKLAHDREYHKRDPEKRNAKSREYHKRNRERLKEQSREYYAANREKVLAQSRAYHAANREERNERRREHHAAHREEVNARQREHHAANREQANERQREYRKQNPEKFKEYRERAAQDPEYRERRKLAEREHRAKNLDQINARRRELRAIKAAAKRDDQKPSQPSSQPKALPTQETG